MTPLDRRRFDALAGYSRNPSLVFLYEELSWFQVGDEKLLGVVVLDLSDRDYGAMVLGRDRHHRFRAVQWTINLPTQAAATVELRRLLVDLVTKPAEFFHQHDEKGTPIDFFAPVVSTERRALSFERLRTVPHYRPALGLMRELAHHFKDPDGNFVEQLQSTGFDARLWEMYLYAVFAEMGYALDREHPRPDFHCVGPLGDFFVEATTVNPSAEPPIVTDANRQSYFDDYVPMRFAGVLRSKVLKEYWTLPHVSGKPFVLAVQDFHAPGSMVHSNTGLLEYLYGRRQVVTEENGKTTIVTTPISFHKWGKRIASNFFEQPGSEHISAVMANPSGTLSKFNRMGVVTRFGERPPHMYRHGFAYQNGEISATVFGVRVDEHYDETWSEGLSVYHNPSALVPLPEDALPDAAHHLLRDGAVVTAFPDFFPVGSRTIYLSARDEEASDDPAPE